MKLVLALVFALSFSTASGEDDCCCPELFGLSTFTVWEEPGHVELGLITFGPGPYADFVDPLGVHYRIVVLRRGDCLYRWKGPTPRARWSCRAVPGRSPDPLQPTKPPSSSGRPPTVPGPRVCASTLDPLPS